MNSKNELYEHALTAVLYAVNANGNDLDNFYKKVATGIISNPIRPRPQDQEDTLALVRKAISDIRA